jgi:hypothetical protein
VLSIVVRAAPRQGSNGNGRLVLEFAAHLWESSGWPATSICMDGHRMHAWHLCYQRDLETAPAASHNSWSYNHRYYKINAKL